MTAQNFSQQEVEALDSCAGVAKMFSDGSHKDNGNYSVSQNFYLI